MDGYHTTKLMEMPAQPYDSLMTYLVVYPDYRVYYQGKRITLRLEKDSWGDDERVLYLGLNRKIVRIDVEKT